MKALKILLIAFAPLIAFSQSSVSALTNQNSTTIYGQKMAPVPYGNMYQGIINSYANLLGSYSNPAWITSFDWSKITGTPTSLLGPLAPGNIFIGNVSSVATGVALSGDGTLSSSGTLSVTKFLGNTIPANAPGALTNNGSGGLSWTSYQTPLSLTTTGTSGTATFVSGVLNVPQYQGAINLTTSGTSGASTLIGTTLNIPQYSNVAGGATNELQKNGGSGAFAGTGVLSTGSGQLTNLNTVQGVSGTRLLIYNDTDGLRLGASSSDIIIDNSTSFFGTPSYGGGNMVIFIGNRLFAPTTNPTGGGILYAEGGALKWRGSSGTVTTIAIP